MPPLLLIVGVAVVGGVLLFSGAAGGTRTYTKADLPKLSELLLSKTYLGRELRLCLQKQTEHSLFSASQTLSYAVGLFTAAATLNPGAALQAARTAQKGLDALGGGDVPCKAELQLTVQQLAAHDALCAQLGLSKDVTYEQVQAIALSLGGFTDDLYASADADRWDRCVKASGLGKCIYQWSQPGHGSGVPKYDPKTGLAIRH